jgi:hypothetical protein
MGKKKARRKGQSPLNLLILGPIFIIISGLIATMLVSTMASVQTSLTKVAGTAAENLTVNMSNQTILGTAIIAGQYGTIGLIIVASIIIGLVFTYIIGRFAPAGAPGMT